MNENTSQSRHRGSLFFPFVLIVLGVVFLLSNLGLLVGNTWDIIFRLWPVLLIVIGLDGIFRRQGFVGAVLIIGVGIVFLFYNFDRLAVDVWQMVFSLWPVMLVAIGFDIVIGRRSVLASFLGVVVIIALLLGALWLYQGVGARAALDAQQITQELDGASRASISLEPGIAGLRVDTQARPEGLLSGWVSPGNGLRVEQDYNLQGDKGVFVLRSHGTTTYSPGPENRWQWALYLNPDVSLELNVEMGLGEAVLNLSELDISFLNVDLGIGGATITLPAEGRYDAQLNGAIGRTVVIIPEGMAARIRVNTGLAAFSPPAGYEKNGDTYTSPGYADAEDRVDITVDQAIGQLVVRQLGR